MVLNELLTNCFRHAFPGERTGTIQIALTDEPASFRMVVEDDGIGLHNDSETAGRSSGQQVVQRIVGSYLKGKCRWESNQGTIVTVEFPKPANYRQPDPAAPAETAAAIAPG
jgi:two-component sensor histidine kinase